MTTGEGGNRSAAIARIAGLGIWQGEISVAPLKGGISNESWVVRDGQGARVVRFGDDYPFHHVERAREVLHMLEEGETTGKPTRIVDDLPLFSAAVKKEASPTRSDAVTEALAAILPDEMTPRDALETLYRLKALAEGSKRKP